MNTKNIIAKGRLYLGKLSRNMDKTGTRNCAAYLEWLLREGENGVEFSAQGEVWQPDKKDIIMGGQCVDELAALFDYNGQAQRIATVWREYHLNGINAGLPAQEAAVAEWEKAGNRYDYAGAVEMLKERGLYEIPLPEGATATGGFPAEVVNGERGYRYGERWVFRAMPDEIIAEIKSWSATPEMIAA